MKGQIISLVLLAFIPFSECFLVFMGFGPHTPTLAIRGRITENGRPVPAYISLEVLYEANGELVPISLVQINSLSNYNLHLSGLVFKNENMTNDAILRIQSLSAYEDSTSFNFKLKDHKTLYEHDIELGRCNKGRHQRREEEDDETLNY